MNIPAEIKANKVWTVIPYETSDLPDIAHFFKKNYTGIGSYGSMDMFYWKIMDNPVLPGIINLVKNDGKIISTTSVTPKRLLLRGQEYKVAEIGDTYTDATYQRQGLFTLLINRSTKDALTKTINFIYGTPNNQSLPGYEKKAKYKIMQNVNIRSLFIPVDIKSYIQLRIGWLTGIYTATLFSTFMYAYSFIKRITIKRKNYIIDDSNELPQDWDNFWEKARINYDFIFSRDRRTIEWRYFKNPGKYNLLVLREEGAIVGYVICRVIYDSKNTTFYVADFLTLQGREEYLEILLFRVLQDALWANVTKIGAWCAKTSPYFRIFRRFGFLDLSGIPLINYQNDFAREVEENCRNLHFTISDSDNI